MKAEKVYNNCNESERAGFLFGLFPARLKEELDEEGVQYSELMKLAEKEFHKANTG